MEVNTRVVANTKQHEASIFTKFSVTPLSEYPTAGHENMCSILLSYLPTGHNERIMVEQIRT
jgi:hypothetical protein